MVARSIRQTATVEPFWGLYQLLGRVHDLAARSRDSLFPNMDLTVPNQSAPIEGSDGSGQTIYDVGMYNGDDTEYYLKKGFRVIGVEANAAYCNECGTRFASEIRAGKLQIINCAVTETEGVIDFFVNDDDNEVSSVFLPKNSSDHWTRCQVPARRLSSLIGEHGVPYYVKLDVENSDRFVLHDLLQNSIVPTYISSESHEIDVFCHLISMGYQRFKLVEGDSVAANFQQHQILTIEGKNVSHDFRNGSAGPFGEDLPGPWLNKGQLLSRLVKDGLGWKDIHAVR
jgi:FkbM family methyltransferase